MDQNSDRKIKWSELSILTQLILTALGYNCGILFLIIVSIIGCVYQNEDFTEGTAYGFTIGQTKQEVYRNAQSKYKKGEIVQIEPDLGREEYLQVNPELNHGHKVANVDEWFDLWNSWTLKIDGEDFYLYTVIDIEESTVSWIGLLRKNHHELELQNEWIAPNMENPPKIFAGQTFKEVYQALLTISRDPAYEKLVVSTGWMVRRPVTKFTQDEYRFISPYDRWQLMYSGKMIHNNYLEFKFANGKLIHINRHRQNFELP